MNAKKKNMPVLTYIITATEFPIVPKRYPYILTKKESANSIHPICNSFKFNFNLLFKYISPQNLYFCKLNNFYLIDLYLFCASLNQNIRNSLASKSVSIGVACL